MAEPPARVQHQPLHITILPRLDPEYIAFHNEHIAQIVPPQTIAWNISIRDRPSFVADSGLALVARSKQYSLQHTNLIAHTPIGTAPPKGWPVFLFFHGGGWTFGNIDSEASFCTSMCSRAKCVVISVNYRLAPENPYPKAVEDAVESFEWLLEHGERELDVDLAKIAIGGSSSGGNLAAVLALKLAQKPIQVPILLQLLIVPVADNTLTVLTSPCWAENEHTAWLSPARMLWFRDNYLPNQEDREKWEASPIFAPSELLDKVPKAWIGVTELDILRDEGLVYGERMKQQGVEVETVVYKSAPHPIMVMDGELHD